VGQTESTTFSQLKKASTGNSSEPVRSRLLYKTKKQPKQSLGQKHQYNRDMLHFVNVVIVLQQQKINEIFSASQL